MPAGRDVAEDLIPAAELGGGNDHLRAADVHQVDHRRGGAPFGQTRQHGRKRSRPLPGPAMRRRDGQTEKSAGLEGVETLGRPRACRSTSAA